MLGAFFVMLISFWIEDYLKQIEATWAQQVPSILYTALVYIMNVYYRKLATYLTEWGNIFTSRILIKMRIYRCLCIHYILRKYFRYLIIFCCCIFVLYRVSQY